MNLGKRIGMLIGALTLGVLVSANAVAQPATRFVLPGGALTSTKILPGQSATFEMRVDSPSNGLVGAVLFIQQTAPATSGFLTVTGRDFTASIFNDTSSGQPDAVVFALPSALLSPANGDNLSRSTIGLVPAAMGSNLYVQSITLTSDPATPLGTYTIQPTSPSSTISDLTTDFAITPASFDIIIGATLSVTKSGTGAGTVTSDIGLINCGATCSDIYPGSTVTLTAAPNAGSTFIGWTGGGCSGTGTCVVTVSAATTVNAQFDLLPQTLTVTLAGTGSGTVTSAPAGINCPGTCASAFAANSTVTLTAVAAGGSSFAGWSGAGCSGVGTCVVTMSAAQAVTATFNLPSFNLTVTKSGTGGGTVTSAPAGINCGATCVAPFVSGSTVTLTAVANGGSSFIGWSGGGCSGTGTCVVTMSAATTVNAQFDLGPQTLTVTLAGTGAGTVSSAPVGIACPGTCAFAFPANSTVTLTAVANAGSAFTGWSGAGCAGTGTCVVTMSAAQAVTATFDLPPVTTITGMPTNPSSVANPQFTFTSSIAGSTFQCQVDGGAIFACSSPLTISVGNGPHTFKVQAIGPGGNLDPVGATYAWTAAGIVIASVIPTLNEWMLMLLALMLGGAGMLMVRRKA